VSDHPAEVEVVVNTSNQDCCGVPRGLRVDELLPQVPPGSPLGLPGSPLGPPWVTMGPPCVLPGLDLRRPRHSQWWRGRLRAPLGLRGAHSISDEICKCLLTPIAFRDIGVHEDRPLGLIGPHWASPANLLCKLVCTVRPFSEIGVFRKTIKNQLFF